MSSWFRHLADPFHKDDEVPESVRAILESAVDRAAGVGFLPVTEGVCPVPNQGSINSIESGAILIQLPKETAASLPVGGRFLMSIDAHPGFELAEVSVLGSWNGVAKGWRPSGVRVSIPKSFEHVQRREVRRLPVAFDLSPLAEIRVVEDAEETLLGKANILDISEAGAQLRMKQGTAIRIGQRIRVDAHFPAAIPDFTCYGEVVWTRFSSELMGCLLGVCFLDPRPNIAAALHDYELQRARRQRR